MRIHNKFLYLFVTLIVVVIVMIGCSDETNTGSNHDVNNDVNSEINNQGNEASDSDESIEFNLGGVIIPENVANFNPLLATGNWSNLFEYLYDPLLYFNPVTGELIPVLAKEMGSLSDDELSYTIDIEEDVEWHDGEPLTSQDIIYTLNTLKENKVLDRYQIWGDGRLEEVVAEGDHKVVFKLQDKFPSFQYYLSTIQVVPEHIFSNEDPTMFLNKEPIGNGPFKFDQVNESAIILVKNENYYQGPPEISKLIINRFNDSSALTLALEKGEIDASDGTIAMGNIPQLLENEDNKIQVYPGLDNYGVYINNQKDELQNIAVRKAIRSAINQKDLIEKAEMDMVYPASPGFLSSIFGDLVDDELFDNPEYNFDPDYAMQLLEEEGYEKNSEGVFEKDGQELAFTYHMAANAPAQNKEGTMITQWLEDVGIKTTVNLATWPELTKLAMAGEYDLIQIGLGTPPDPQAALEVFHSKMSAPVGENTPGLNYMRLEDSQIDEWLDESFAADTEDRQELYLKIQHRITELAPYAPMYNVGGHLPYSSAKFTNYNEEVPVVSSISLRQVQKK